MYHEPLLSIAVHEIHIMESNLSNKPSFAVQSKLIMEANAALSAEKPNLD